ncbi:MAG: FAD-dependent oxidoreductase [Candidatus Pacearchaeota archaeon]
MKIAIVGGGIFGLTIASVLAKEGFEVDLYEKEKDVFMAASGINQFRLHRGYHYPRSKETINDCLQGEKRFKEFYPEAIINSPNKHYYAIAKEKSFLNADQIFKIWSEQGLFYEVEDLDILNKNAIEKCARVKESLIDPQKFKEVCLENCKKYGVKIFLNKKVNYEDLKDYDLIVSATYSFNNFILDKFSEAQKNYQFELVEKVVLKLPERFTNLSVVIIDGPFMCIDPYGRTGFSLMGNVIHAIHHSNIGKYPEIPRHYKELLNKGIIKNPKISKIDKFLDSAEEFFPEIKKEAKHVGSMFTIRTVLPYREHDDARPTIVEKINNKIVSVFSGKIPTCVDAAEQVLKIAKEKKRSKEMKVGIIGIGRWGRNLVRVFDENSNLTICANKSSISNSQFIKEKYPKIKVTNDYNEILNDPSIEAVVIATPIETHFEIAKKALIKGKKVFLEKPIAKNISDARELIKLSKKKFLFVGHIFLYNPCYKKIKELISEEKISSIETRWNKLGTFNEDIFLNLVSQDLAIVYGLIGKTPEKIKLNRNEGVISDSDIVSLELIFEKDLKSKININRSSPTKNKEVEVITKNGEVYYWINDKIFKLNKISKEFDLIFKSNEESLEKEVKDFLDHAKENSEHLTNKNIALGVMEILDRIEMEK